jgi:hypothetical protein
MHAFTISTAAVLLALAPSALAVGSASVTNMCPYPVYYASISGQSEALQAMYPGGGMSQAYSQEGTGVSIKLAMNDSLSGPISQFEYTWAAGKINYDLSNINGYPFSSGGMTVTPSISNDPNNPTCVPIVCPAGASVCSAAYNAPDDTRTMVCSDAASISLTLCSGWSSKRDVDVHIHARSNTRTIRHPHGRVWVSV